MKAVWNKIKDLFLNNHIFKLCTKAVLVMLACCMSVQLISADPEATTTTTTTSGTTEKTYVSDIIIAYSDISADDAKNQLTSAGYTIVDENLNEGTVKSSGSTKSYTDGYAYMGYKTTDNVDDAITDISMMNMNGGYTLVDYADIIKKQNSAYYTMALELKDACAEFRENVAKGSPAAVRALKALNTVYVSETVQEPLGTWLLDEERTENDFVEAVYRQTTAQTLALVYNQIMLGVYDSTQTTAATVKGSEYLKVSAQVLGRDWKDDEEYTYTLTRKTSTNPMPSGSSNGVSKITLKKPESGNTQTGYFGDITFEKEGTYQYTIAQTKGNDSDTTYDTSVYSVTIVVEYDSTTKTYSPKTITMYKSATPMSDYTASFTNKYNKAVLEGSKNLKVETELTGKAWEDESFTYTLTAGTSTATDGTVPMPSENTITVTKPDTGDTAFGNFGDITYSQAGTYNYTITQDGNESTAYNVVVTVTEDNGVLTATSEMKNGDSAAPHGRAFFSNDSTTDGVVLSGNQKLHVSAALSGREWSDTDSFTYALYAEGTTEPLQTITLTKDHQDAGFSYITYTEAGTYNYTISQISGTDETITYDSAVYNVSVVVTRDETTDVLSVSKTMTKNGSEEATEASFTNIYTAPETTETTGTEDSTSSETTDTTQDSSTSTSDTNSLIVKNSWAYRMSKNWSIDYETVNATKKDQARSLITTVKTFYEDYTTAKAAVDANNGTLDLSDISTEDQAEQVTEDVLSGTETNTEGLTQAENAVAYVAYNMLKQYSFGVTNIADYLLSIGKRLADGEDESNVVEDLYPMACALTDGQYAVIRVVGIEQFMICMNSDEAAFAKADAEFDAAYQKMLDANNGEKPYAFDSTDADKWENQVGYTDEARRRISAGELYEQYQKEIEDNKVTTLDIAYNYVMFIFEVASATYSTVLLFASIGYTIATGTIVGMSAASAMMTANITSSVLGFLQGSLVAGPKGVLIAAIITLVVIGIIYLVRWIMDLYNYYNPTYTDIPIYMYDKESEDGNIMEYKVARNADGKAVDINLWHGTQWNALYYTKDKSAGSPIVLDKDGNFLIIKQNDSTIPEYYSPLTKFGESVAANLNENQYKSEAPALYAFFQRSSQYDDEQAGIKAEEERRGTYLESIIVGSATTEEAARAIINKAEGYQVVDFDLTWNDSSTFTYIGYKTTKSSAGAVRDIRIGLNTTAAAYTYGGSSYGLAGTVNGCSIYYTKSETAGDPIVANIVASRKSITTEDTYMEPINLFSGGEAFDLLCNFHLDNTTENHTYLYFENSVMYNAENSKEYLGGFTFVGYVDNNTSAIYSPTTSEEKTLIDGYSKYLGLTAVKDQDKVFETSFASSNYEVTGGQSWVDSLSGGETNVSSARSYFYYSTTYNPKRAIYDIKTYEAEIAASTVPSNMTSDSIGYGAVARIGVSSEFGLHTSSGYDVKNIIRARNDYYATFTDFSQSDKMYYYKMISGYMGLYVAGPISGYEPMTIDDISFTYDTDETEEKLKDSEWWPVCDLTDVYNESPTNLVPIATYLYQGVYNNMDFLNMFIKKGNRTEKTKKKYIKSIQVMYSNTNDYSAEVVKQTLLASGGDEIIKFNLSTKTGEAYLDKAGTKGVNDFTRSIYEAAKLVNKHSNGSKSQVATVDGKYTDKCAYIRVTRTDNANEALTDILIYDVSKNSSEMASGVSTKIKRNGVTYTLATAGSTGTATKISSAAYSDFYLYTTTSYAARDGAPITDITFSTDPLENGAYTVKEDQGSTSDAKVYDRAWYMHLETANTTQYDYSSATTVNGVKKTADLRYVDSVQTVLATSVKAAQIELVNRDCTFMIDGDLYAGGNGTEQCFIGYHKGSSSKKAYKNIILMPLTVANSVELKNGVMQINITYQGVPYSLICETCLNGKFLFATKDTGAGPAITNLMVGNNLANAKTSALADNSMKLADTSMMESIYWRAMESEYNQVLSDANFAAGFGDKSGTRYVYLGTEEQYVKPATTTTMTGSVLSDPDTAMLAGLSSLFVSIAVIYYALHRSRKKKKEENVKEEKRD